MGGEGLIRIRCYGNDVTAVTGILNCGAEYALKHVEGDPSSVYRFYLTGETFSLEITPAKGLSVRDFFYNDRQFFWNSPVDNLPDPERINMEGTVIINGRPEKGTRWLEYFVSHIEMLGIDNWGVPVEKDGRILGLHGNVSSIPVTDIILEEKNNRLVVSGFFYVHDPVAVVLKDGKSRNYFRVEKQIELFLNKPALLINDRIINVDNKSRFPDWGYHVQLRPEKGCRYLIPSKKVKKRGGGIPEDDFELWNAAGSPENRLERGYIHTNLLVSKGCFPDGAEGIETLLLYGDGSGIKCTIPLSPYTLSWFSCGGRNSTEFMIPGQEGKLPEKILRKNWDGVGPEIGASALDHDGDTDPAIVQTMIKPGESVRLQIYLEQLIESEAEKLSLQIKNCNSKRADK